ncbi:hypothetical protein [Prescottella equi]|nr:hypothetical protein [Prescottella equi]
MRRGAPRVHRSSRPLLDPITAHGVGKLREEVEVLRLLLDVLDSR